MGWQERRDDQIDDGSSSGAGMRDIKVLLWTTSSGKRLWLGGGRRRVWGFAGFCGLGIRMGGRMGCTTKKYTSVMIRVCHSRSLFIHACTSMTNL